MMKKILPISFLFLLSALAASGQTGLPVYDRLVRQRECYPLERVYVHTDAEDYLQGDRIWLKAYLMDETEHTPVDSTLYVYVELFDRTGAFGAREKLLRRQGAFYGYLDIPEDLPSGEAYLRAYTRYMASAPETAFTKRITVGRGGDSGTAPDQDGQGLSVRRRPHGFELQYPGKDPYYLLALRGGKIGYLGAVRRGRTVRIPDQVLPSGPLDFLVVDRNGKVVSQREGALPDEGSRLAVPVSLDKPSYLTGELVSIAVRPEGLKEGELLDVSVSVTCRPLLRRHLPASITDYVLERTLGFDYSPALKGTPVEGKKEPTAALTGSVRSLVLGRPVQDARVCLVSPEAGVLDVCRSGPDGRFRIEGLDYPSGTKYLVKSTDSKGKDRFDLVVDEERFPAFRIPADPYETAPDGTLAVIYGFDDNPFGTVALEAAGVSATVDGPPSAGFNRMADFAVTLRQIEQRGYTNLEELLREVPGIFIREVPDDAGLMKPRAYLRGVASIEADTPAAIAVDGTILDGEYDLDLIRMPDIARVDIFKTGQTVLWGSRGAAGVISILTKSGNQDLDLLYSGETVHRTAAPLGYQRPSDFLSDRPHRNQRTVYWNPLLLTSDFSFPLGDVPGTYLMVIDGVTSDGRLVHEERSFEVSREDGEI